MDYTENMVLVLQFLDVYRESLFGFFQSQRVGC